tara:strand:+ start:29247 stop:30680 length:1434 start_codon:yes stop_codon:yes gene_type:complete
MVSCAVNPVTGNRELAFMSEFQEISIGAEADIQIKEEMGVYKSPALQEYVQELGVRLATNSHRPNLSWHFTILDSPVINAFALPGGYTYLTRGILAYLNTEAELVGVLGHEIAHVTARHAVQAYTRATGAQLGLTLGQIFIPQMRSNPLGLPGLDQVAGSGLGLLFLKFGREDEKQADRLGAEYALNGGWHPEGALGMLSTLSRISATSEHSGLPSWFSTHPNPESRVQDMSTHIKELLAKKDSKSLSVDRFEYLRRVEGLDFGEDPQKGLIQDNSFLHPILLFRLDFPKGWSIQNNDEAVLAQDEHQEVSILLQLKKRQKNQELCSLSRKTMDDEGYTFLTDDLIEINELKACIGSYRQTLDGDDVIVARVAHINHDKNIYFLFGYGVSDSFSFYEKEIEQSFRSFRVMDKRRAESIKPSKVSLYVVQSGDTWHRIQQDQSSGVVDAETLAILNGYSSEEDPLAGSQIKIVRSVGF